MFWYGYAMGEDSIRFLFWLFLHLRNCGVGFWIFGSNWTLTLGLFFFTYFFYGWHLKVIGQGLFIQYLNLNYFFIVRFSIKSFYQCKFWYEILFEIESYKSITQCPRKTSSSILKVEICHVFKSLRTKSDKLQIQRNLPLSVRFNIKPQGQKIVSRGYILDHKHGAMSLIGLST